MRGSDYDQSAIFSYVSPEERIPQDHPLRLILEMANQALREMSGRFAEMYSGLGRVSIPPEQLLRALLLQVLYTIRSERGETLLRDTHESKTDPDAQLYRKSAGGAFRLCHMGHVLMENRNGIPVAGKVTEATTRAEWEAAIEMLQQASKGKHATVGGDAGYDTAAFVQAVREIPVTPHVAQHTKRASMIDGRTTRHEGYQISLKKRMRIEQIFGWLKTVGGMRKVRHRGRGLVQWMFTLALSAYTLVRLRTITLQAVKT
jgi:hypothetical protein